MTKSDF